MPSGKKVGRRPRRLSEGERQLIEEFGRQLSKELSKIGQKDLCKRLKICKASLYNYLNHRDKETLPSYDLLKRAHDELGFQFRYLDFSKTPQRRRRAKTMLRSQGVLPFLELLRKDDIQVVSKRTVEGENALELTVRIRFAG